LELPFRETLTHLKQEFGLYEPSQEEALKEALAFYQSQLQAGEARYYLYRRGIHDSSVMRQMGMGYAPGGILRRHMLQLGYSFDLLLQVGLINGQGHDTFCRRIVLPCFRQERLVNLYGRSTEGSTCHRFLRGPKGGLFAWNIVRSSPSVILVEGLFDLAVLWQSGLVNATSALGAHLSQLQLGQLCDQPDRQVFIAFDSDPNGAGQGAARFLAQRLTDAGLTAFIVNLPEGQDPNSYFVSGASAEEFRRRLEAAENRWP
jgi:DNA primase